MHTTRQRRHATVAASSIAALATWALVTEVAGVDLTVQFPHASITTVGLATLMPATAAAVLLGWALLGALETRVRRARRSWMLAVLGAFLLSLILPAAFATTVAAAIGLITIHVVVTAVAVAGLAGIVPARRRVSGTGVTSPTVGQPLS